MGVVRPSPRVRSWLAACALASVLTAACGGASAPPAPAADAGARSGERAAESGGDAARIVLGSHTYRVTTSVPEAQKAFDRGLVLAYAFNHGAAEKEFRSAAQLDQTCAMAWWGVAHVNGPHINNPVVSPEQARTAWEAVTKALELAPRASATERELIAAQAKRFAASPTEDRRPLDEAHAAAMREVWRAHPDDADVAALFAESMMDLRPWDLWTADGKPHPGTEEILATLERAMEIAPSHPLANHLYIHAVEGSPDPGRGAAAADRLRNLVPGAGHLVHMPAHIDVRTGRWPEAAVANERAIAADAAWRAAHPGPPGFYAVYMAHNRHFLGFTAMMEGRSAAAIASMREMVAEMPPEFVRDSAAFADGLVAAPIETLMRFGRWEEILAEPEPSEHLPVSRAIRRFARAAALTSLDRGPEAEKEREAFRASAAAVPEGAFVGNNSAKDILAIASRVLDGEMAAREKKFDVAIAALEEAARMEDRLKYDEPPDWVQPVRHTLGAVLLRAGRYGEAEAVYREDLARFPANGWSLLGLGRALRLQRKEGEAAKTEAEFAKAWSRADIEIAATCLCQPPV